MTTNGVAERELDLVELAIAEDIGISRDTAASEIEFLRQWTPIDRQSVAGTEDDDWAKLSDNAEGGEKTLGDPKIVFAMSQPSGVSEEGLIRSLKEKVGAVHVEIEDMSGGCGQAFSAIIVSPLFDKKTTLARHRMVNTALKAEVAAIHAWTPKCYTPEQWEKQGGAVAPGKTATGEVVEGTNA